VILTFSAQTYYATYCVGAEPGILWYRPLLERYDCDDGGFDFYKRCATITRGYDSRSLNVRIPARLALFQEYAANRLVPSARPCARQPHGCRRTSASRMPVRRRLRMS
jgi:hypothetical protein